VRIGFLFFIVTHVFEKGLVSFIDALDNMYFNHFFDRNAVGYPKEPFAVSNNLRPFTLLHPSYDRAKIIVTAVNKHIQITLLNN
jgi:uncharacterized protein (DUF2141 family)